MIGSRLFGFLLFPMGLHMITDVHGQDSLSTCNLNEVVVTATRSERALSDLPVPVTVISGSQIKEMGSLRLSDVLSEQTGMTLVTDHGTGIQLQGFSPEYTLILIDGEPLIGRTSGTLELSRVTVGNIKQIEVIKGPSSSLYGSEALAGVINIITTQPKNTSGSVTTRYGSNNTLDLGTGLSYQRGKIGISLYANRYHTDGYDLSPETAGETVSPFTNYTFQSRVTYSHSDKTKMSVSGRYFDESQSSVTDVGTVSEPVLLDGRGKVKDWNINPVFSHYFSDRLKTTFRLYGSGYKTNSYLTYQQGDGLYDASYFNQTFLRPEIQSEYFFNKRNTVTLGVGRIWESVEATRYDEKMKYQTNYLYAQYEWLPVDRLNVLAGVRFDNHSVYGSQLSPKLSAQYSVLPWLDVRGSFGVGFKAPDFRQLYLNFTNATVGYTVLGSETLLAGIESLQKQNQIESILVDPASFGDIKAETSTSYNLGVRIQATRKSSIKVNFFRNDIHDLIDTKAVALKTNEQQVFSYYNIAEVFTQGAETEFSYALFKGLTVSAGYQFLIAKDKEVQRSLKAGTVYARDPETNTTYRVNPDDYGGLLSRSRNMANVKVFYNNQELGWGLAARLIYRGRYGFSDVNNNAILDADSEYVDGYATCNISVSKTLIQILRLQIGCDNVFDYTDKQYIPSLPGRLMWASLALTLPRNNKL